MYFSKLFYSNSEDLDLFAQVSLIMIGAKLCRTVAFESWIWGTQLYTVNANVYTKNLSDMHKNQQCECVMHCTLLLSFIWATSKSMSIYRFRCGFYDLINHAACLMICNVLWGIWFHLISQTAAIWILKWRQAQRISANSHKAHLRALPSSKGGIMTTFTVTEVRSRSIIWSCESVTAATLQISTKRLPCRSPACQAKPYSSTSDTVPSKRTWKPSWPKPLRRNVISTVSQPIVNAYKNTDRSLEAYPIMQTNSLTVHVCCISTLSFCTTSLISCTLPSGTRKATWSPLP